MPGYRGHLIFALGIFAALWITHFQYVCDISLGSVGCLMMLAGALFPDCDTRSKGRKILNIIILPLCALLWYKRLYFLLAYAGVVICCVYLSPHRGMTHSLWFPSVGLITLYVYFTHYNMAVPNLHWMLSCFALGYVSHVFLDHVVVSQRY